MCKRCGVDGERYVDGRCKACSRAKNSAWSKVYLASEKGREKSNAASRKYNATHAVEKAALFAAYRATHKDAINAYRKRVRQSNPNNDRIKRAKRRALKIQNGGVVSSNIVELLFKKQNGLCACCGAILGATYHIDHIMPLTLGGKHADENLQLLLPRCNMQKYNMHPEKFRARRVKEGVAYEKNKEYNACSPGQSGASD